MTHIELPRALEDYFAYAEIDPTRNGRRFTISLPYFEGNRLDRLQWWYHLTRDQEQRLGDAALETLRAQATARFRKHIERWLQNTGQRLHGADPIPRLGPVIAVATSEPASNESLTDTPHTVVPWPAERVANG
jgi:hypothetical protein